MPHDIHIYLTKKNKTRDSELNDATQAAQKCREASRLMGRVLDIAEADRISNQLEGLANRIDALIREYLK